MRVVKDDRTPPSPEDVDRILEKISANGLESLSEKERETLDKASKHRSRT
jgi:hypothetical protein